MVSACFTVHADDFKPPRLTIYSTPDWHSGKLGSMECMYVRIGHIKTPEMMQHPNINLTCG